MNTSRRCGHLTICCPIRCLPDVVTWWIRIWNTAHFTFVFRADEKHFIVLRKQRGNIIPMLCPSFFNLCWFYLTAQTWEKKLELTPSQWKIPLLLRKTDTNVNSRSQYYSGLWTWCCSVCVLLCAPFILHKAATLSDSSQSHREGQTEKMSQSSFSCLLKSGSVFHISFTRHNFKWNFMLWSTADNTKRKRLK